MVTLLRFTQWLSLKVLTRFANIHINIYKGTAVGVCRLQFFVFFLKPKKNAEKTGRMRVKTPETGQLYANSVKNTL